jgi:hypothetical protein
MVASCPAPLLRSMELRHNSTIHGQHGLSHCHTPASSSPGAVALNVRYCGVGCGRGGRLLSPDLAGTTVLLRPASLNVRIICGIETFEAPEPEHLTRVLADRGLAAVPLRIHVNV